MATMKRVKITKPRTVFDRPFRLTDFRQPQTNSVPYKCQSCGAEGVTEQPAFIEEADLVDLLEMLILNIPRQKCTMQDSINAFDFMQQKGESKKESEDGVLKLTDGIHKWLGELVKNYGALTYGINARALEQALDNFERPHEKKGK